MKYSIVSLIAAGLLIACSSAQAESDTACSLPAYLLVTESPLKKVAAAINDRKQLEILVIGSGSSALAGSDGVSGSYPARLEATLRTKLPGVTVNVKTDLRPKKTSAEVADSFEQAIEKFPPEQKPVLAIWQTGTVDAITGSDPDDFRSALDLGVANLQKAGTDVLLMNLQYNPRMETMVSVAPYLDTMRVVAQQHDIPLFDRFSIMRHWSDAGDFDLFGATHGLGMAKRVHDCIGRSLSTFIIEASGVKPAELGIQR